MQLQENIIFDNHYTLLRQLGRGGFSEVWLAHDSYMDLDVALKIYAPGQGMDEHSIEELRREIKVVFTLNHPNLLTPKYLGVWKGMPYLVLAYCSRGSLTQQIGKLSEQELWHVLHDVAAGLAYLHKNDIVHQDIKPDNILLDESGNYVITDFGISTKARSTLRKSVIGGAVSGGTMAYMGPERFSKQPAPTKASDIWSLGAMMFELITGNVPFGEMGGGMQKGGAEIPDITENNSEDLKAIIEQMLAFETWDRPTAEKLVEMTTAQHATTSTPSSSRATVQSTMPQQLEQEQPTSSRETQRFVPNGIAENPREEVQVEPITKAPVKKKRKWWIWVIIVTCVLGGIAIYLKSEAIKAYNLVYNEYVTNDSLLHDSIATLDEHNYQLYSDFGKSYTDNPANTQEWLDKAQEVQFCADSLFNYIQNFKEDIAILADGQKTVYEWKTRGMDPTMHIENCTNFNIPTKYVIKDGNGVKLKSVITYFRDNVSNMVEKNSELYRTITTTLATNPIYNTQKNEYCEWEIAMFKGVAVGKTINILSDLQKSTRYVEGIIVQYLYNQSISSNVTSNEKNPIDRFVVDVMPQEQPDSNTSKTGNIRSGLCGKNVRWELNTSTGILTIIGKGPMADWGGAFQVAWINYKNIIRSVVVQEGITVIGKYAFTECSKLTTVSLPNSVTTIGGDAFSRCVSLTTISIPNSVSRIGRDAFRGCESMKSIVIPNSVREIGGYAFCQCTSLITIKLPTGLTTLSQCLFSNCSSLKSLEIPSEITKIEYGAFWGCSSLTSIHIPKNVKEVGKLHLFEKCTSLQEITYPADLDMSHVDVSPSTKLVPYER